MGKDSCSNENDEKIAYEKIEGVKIKEDNGQVTGAQLQHLNVDCDGKTEVFLRIYDLSGGMARAMSQQLLGFKIDGVWHTSIEIFGKEYYFQQGLISKAAGTTNYGPVIERISMGHTECKQADLDDFFEVSKGIWSPESYDLFTNNCNNFSEYLSQYLLSKGIPQHILDLPENVKKSPIFKQLFSFKQ
ncbi:desumoylating isopeptidase 1 [Enteropsectra breve]|nr:desumoylating isopeptidase 1 [Enteropsectra breve]